MNSDNCPWNKPSSDEEPQRLIGLGRCLIGLLTITVLAQVAVVDADVVHLQILNRLAAGEVVTLEMVSATDRRAGLAALLDGTVFLVTVVVWIVWFRRAYGNVTRLARIEPRFAKGWAIGAWFVPLLNFVRPKQIANDIWRSCDPTLRGGAPVWTRPVSPLLHVWWAAWVALTLVDRFATRRLFGAETIADQQNAAIATLVADACWVPITVLAAVVVAAVTDRYERRRSEVLEQRAEASGAAGTQLATVAGF